MLMHAGRVHFNHRNFARLRERDSGYVRINETGGGGVLRRAATCPNVAIKGFIKHDTKHSLALARADLRELISPFFLSLRSLPFRSFFSLRDGVTRND